MDAAAAAAGFEFFYVERGQKSSVEFFDSETEACLHAYKIISREKWFKSHLVGFFDSEKQADECVSYLQESRIEYFKDAIPYGGKDDPRYRIFVFGNDFKKVQELNGGRDFLC